MTQPPVAEYRFGPFRYDPSQHLLFRGEEVVPLVPKVADTLEVLLERRGQVVSKPDLMNAVWPGCTVEEIGLARNISILRKALGDDAETYIETVPKRGYRFAAAESTARRDVCRRTGTWVAAIATVLLLAVIVYWQFYRPSRYALRSHGAASLAVMPVDCLTPDLQHGAFATAFNEVLVEELSRQSAVQLVSPSTVERYRRLQIPAAIMSRMLGLDVIVEGTAQTFGSQVRISVRLTDVHSGKLIWADSYDRPVEDLSQVQSEVAHAAASEIGRYLSR
jgi:DNA-binding winged helix-turn-helix (wHTH) protein/TolB-like protein